ncbi:hypothetical protein [Sphingobacterium chungjuense]|uniref:hypothetical protein n=1 Tax=Sphingobacterium chungjuense TaxID=2675553 RepID=UPI00140AD873|nr:hypothetical protein [Sphingobacterium chungjuense]
MLIKCPRCNNSFRGRSIHIANSKNVTFQNNYFEEICPRCGNRFNGAPKDGVYDFVGDVPVLIKDLSSLVIPKIEKMQIATLQFNKITTEEDLVNKTKDIDRSLFEVISNWIGKGVAFISIIAALNSYSTEITKSFDSYTSQIVNTVNNAKMIPDSAKRSYIKSFEPLKKNHNLDVIDPANFGKKGKDINK